jgi:iron complex transport system ATP-binding protein
MPSGESASSALSIQSLTFGYEPGRSVILDFTADLPRGKITALIGPNATGKTTLLRLLLGHFTPWSGSVLIDQHRADQLDPRRRAAWLSFVPQRARSTFAFSVHQVVNMGRFAVNANPQAVQQALDSCDLASLQHETYSTLSIGQQQRVLIARAIAQSNGQGRIMLLDEPGSAMDLWHLHHTMQILHRLAHEGLSILVVLHDLNLAARYADDVWLMHQGRLTAHGPWDTIMQPRVLEPVYGVKLRVLNTHNHERPIFDVQSIAHADHPITSTTP